MSLRPHRRTSPQNAAPVNGRYVRSSSVKPTETIEIHTRRALAPIDAMCTARDRYAMGVQVGFHGGLSRLRRPSSLALAPEPLRTSSLP